MTEIKEETSAISESMSLLEGDSGRGKDLSPTESFGHRILIDWSCRLAGHWECKWIFLNERHDKRVKFQSICKDDLRAKV